LKIFFKSEEKNGEINSGKNFIQRKKTELEKILGKNCEQNDLFGP